MVNVLSFNFDQCFGPFTMVFVEGSYKTGHFWHLPKHLFRSPSSQKCITYEGDRLFANIQKKIFFISEIIASENVAINILY